METSAGDCDPAEVVLTNYQCFYRDSLYTWRMVAVERAGQDKLRRPICSIPQYSHTISKYALRSFFTRPLPPIPVNFDAKREVRKIKLSLHSSS